MPRPSELVSNRASGARVHAERQSPPEDLAKVVETLWHGRWALPEQAPHTTELLADPSVHLVFEGGEARVVGVWTRLWTRSLTGTGHVFGVKLRPGAVQAFLRREAHAYTDRFTPLVDEVPGAEVVRARLAAPRPPTEAFGVLVDWLREQRRPASGVAAAVRMVAELREGRIQRVDALAEGLGLGVRALQRQFRVHVGASPKWVLRWARLQRVAQSVELGAAPDLAELAIALGYSDQAHLARDFRSATGRTLRGFEAAVHAPDVRAGAE